MQRKRYYYIIAIQYLGFRFHGWQKQPEVNTVQRMVERTLAYILEHKNFKVLAAGRTDAKVSVNQSYIELFLDAAPLNLDNFISLFNKNLPQDIKALSVEETTAEFNIINHAKLKEYLYLFSFGEKTHPFCASLMVNFEAHLDIALMNKAAQLFEGTHDFRNFCYKPTENTITTGTINYCRITENTQYTANFFPKKSYVLTVIGGGFKRNQIRIMMARLVQLGKGEYTLKEIQEAINMPNIEFPISYIAPASGLILNRVILKNDPV